MKFYDWVVDKFDRASKLELKEDEVDLMIDGAFLLMEVHLYVQVYILATEILQ